MKIRKIEDRINLEEQFDVELQYICTNPNCLTDCPQYMNNSKANYEYNKRNFTNYDGGGVDLIREVTSLGLPYCWKTYNAETSKWG